MYYIVAMFTCGSGNIFFRSTNHKLDRTMVENSSVQHSLP